MRLWTAGGAITPDELGATLMHEHLVTGFPGWEVDGSVPVKPMAELVARCAERIEELKSAGFSSLVDPCPMDLGRDPELYAEVAARTGFNILFATGLYNEHLGGSYWRLKLRIQPTAWEELADLYVRELTDGVGSSGLRPALIKLAVGDDPTSVFEELTIKAAAKASNATGAPILTHTEAVFGDVLLDKLKALGVPAHRVLIGHSCGSSDRDYHRRIVDGGAYIGFDRFGMNGLQKDEVRTERLHNLIQDGFAQQILVSHDCVFCQRGAMMSEPMLETMSPLHFTRNIAPALRALGVAQATVDGLVRDNPRRYFCEEVPARTPVAAPAAAG